MKRSPLRHALAVLRLEIGYGQKELAGDVKCSRATIQAVELGHLKLSESLATRISLETGVDLNWLLDNRLSEPIAPSAEARTLWSQIKGSPSTKVEYSRELFDLVRAHREDPEPLSRAWGETMHNLERHARLQAILENARNNHLYELARYKTEKFIEDMQNEFGFADQVVDLRDAGVKYDEDAWKKALNFATLELKALQRYYDVASDDRDPRDIPPRQREEIARFLTLTRVSSPYEDASSPEVIERVNKARAQEKETARMIGKILSQEQGKLA